MWKKVVFCVVLGLLVSWSLKLMLLLDVFKEPIHKHHPGPCGRLPVIEHGSEDMELLPGGRVLITSGLRTVLMPNNSIYGNRKGAVFSFDMESSHKPPESVTIHGLQGLNPHGMSSWTDRETGRITVFIVNQKITKGKSVVEKFHYDKDKNVLHHIKTIGNDYEFRMLNDVVAVSEDEFYFTNSVHYHSAVELYLMIPWGSVAFYDGQRARFVASGLSVPNGISVSPDGRFIYVAMWLEKSVQIFRRQQDNSLTWSNTTYLHTAPDNVNVDPVTGDVLVACAPSLMNLLKYVDNPEEVCQGHVLRLKVSEGHVTDVCQVMADDGDLISGCSVAVHHNGIYLFGSVVSNAALCHSKDVQ